MSYKPKMVPDQPAANDPKYVVIELRERIAELEALQALDREYMDKAEIRISELEAQIQRDEKYRDELLYSRAECVERAEQLETRYSDAVAKHENELALRLEAALAALKGLYEYVLNDAAEFLSLVAPEGRPARGWQPSDGVIIPNKAAKEMWTKHLRARAEEAEERGQW